MGLAFGFGLQALDVISFYYLFIPLGSLPSQCIRCSSKYGAKRPIQKKKEEELRNETIQRFQAEQAKNEPVHPKDVSIFSKVLKIYRISLWYYLGFIGMQCILEVLRSQLY